MIDNAPDMPLANAPSDFDSRDCINVIIDCHMDGTIRPSRPALIEAARKEKERLARWQKENEEQSRNETNGEKSGETPA